MGSSGGGQTSQSTSKTQMPAWELPEAKAYLSSLAGLIFPNANFSGSLGGTAPAPAGTSPGNTTGASGSSAASTPTSSSSSTPQTALNQAFMNPMIASSPYLQALFAANPAGAQGSMGGAAYQQLAQLYGGNGGMS
jgi:hypothetical protein